MRAFAVIGIVLILLGVVALTYQGITYMKREAVVDVGPVHVDAERPHTIPIPPVVGGAAVLAGVALIIVGMRRSAGSGRT